MVPSSDESGARRLRVVHLGAGEAVVVKPAGLSSDDRQGGGESALGQARELLGWPEARLPHRLDRITRGYLLVARDASSAAWHAESIRARRWTKGYLARLDMPSHGEPRRLLGPHKRYLRRQGTRATCVRSGGDPSFLEILAVAPAPPGPRLGEPGAVDVAIHLRTGRFHQIRAMCADLGAPVAGDGLYGSAARASPVLEHAFLRFVSTEGGTVTLFDPEDAGRPPMAREVILTLEALRGEPSGSAS